MKHHTNNPIFIILIKKHIIRLKLWSTKFNKHATSKLTIVGLLHYLLQAQPIDSELAAKLLGRGVAVSPVVTVEPRRRKFHKAITLSMPAPRAHSQGMINQYSGSVPTLRLLCSITGQQLKIHLYYTFILIYVILYISI